MTDTTPWATAYAQHRRDVAAAVAYTDWQATPDEVAKHRAQMLRAARDRLAAAIPEVPESSAPKRADVVAARLPRTADDVAAQGREREKILALLDAGRSLGSLVAQADEVRLAAIIDSIETLPGVLASSDPEGVAAELRDLAFRRLVDLGAPDAVAVAHAEAVTAPTAAWSRLMREALDGEPTLGARQAVYQADRPGYEAVLATDPDLGDAVRRATSAVERIGTA